jgi:hypothetical protein
MYRIINKDLLNLIFMDPCILDNSVEIPTRCSFVVEFIIPKFIEGSTCFELHSSSSEALNCTCSLWFIYPCSYQPLPSLDNGRSPREYINQMLQIQFRSPDDEQCAA